MPPRPLQRRRPGTVHRRPDRSRHRAGGRRAERRPSAHLPPPALAAVLAARPTDRSHGRRCVGRAAGVGASSPRSPSGIGRQDTGGVPISRFASPASACAWMPAATRRSPPPSPRCRRPPTRCGRSRGRGRAPGAEGLRRRSHRRRAAAAGADRTRPARRRARCRAGPRRRPGRRGGRRLPRRRAGRRPSPTLGARSRSRRRPVRRPTKQRSTDGGAESADVADLADDPVDDLGLAAPAVGGVGEPGRHQRLGQVGLLAALQPDAVAPGAAAAHGGERLSERGRRDGGHERALAVGGGDRHGVAGEAVEEVGRAVDRVDEPRDAARAGVVGALLADDGVVGPLPPQRPDDQRLRRVVELGDHVRAAALGLDVGDAPRPAAADEGAGLLGQTLGEREQVIELAGGHRAKRSDTVTARCRTFLTPRSTSARTPSRSRRPGSAGPWPRPRWVTTAAGRTRASTPSRPPSPPGSARKRRSSCPRAPWATRSRCGCSAGPAPG